MKKKITEEIEIPEGIEIEIDEMGNVTIKGPKGETSKKLISKVINISKKDNKVIVECKKGSRKEKSIVNTFRSHIKNLIKGVQEPYIYKLKICSGHFPMTVKTENNELIIQNFLGENIPRKAKINQDVNINIEGDIITLESPNKESAGETASKIERSTRITNRDRRVFQDGIFLTSKGDRQIGK